MSDKGDSRLELFPLMRPLVGVSMSYGRDYDIVSLVLDFGDGVLVEVQPVSRKPARLDITRVVVERPQVTVRDAVVDDPVCGWRGAFPWVVVRSDPTPEGETMSGVQTVVFDCPETGEVVNAGMQMDQSSFDTAVITNYTTTCRSCHERHVLNKEDMRLGPKP